METQAIAGGESMSNSGGGLRGRSASDPRQALHAQRISESIGPLHKTRGFLMPATNSSSHCVVRCDTSRTGLAALCLIALAATSLTAYRMGVNRTTAAARHTATATIYHWQTPSNGHNEYAPEGSTTLNAADVERQIVSGENLHRVLRQTGVMIPSVEGSKPSDSGGGTLERIGRSLRVTAAETSSRAGLRISVTCTDEDAGRVVRVVNALAEAYREQYRVRREARIGREWDEARDAAQRARRQFLEAQARFDDFVGSHFDKQQALAKRGPQPSVSPPPSVKPVDLSAPADPRKTENSERVELEQQLAGLEMRRDALLTSRTRVHPVVLAVEQRIARLEERLASIPMETPPVEHTEPSAEEGLFAAAEAERQYAATIREFGARKETLDQARREYDRLLALQRGSRERQFQGARVEVELADSSEPIGAATASPGLLLVALAAGLAVASGVGLIKSGFDTDPPLGTLEQAEMAVRVPIVGVIPGASDGTASEPSRFSTGLAKIVSGASLVALSFGFLVLVY